MSRALLLRGLLSPRLWPAQLLGNALLLVGFAGWLQIRVATLAEVAANAAGAFALVFGALWLHAGCMSLLRGGGFRRALRHLLPFFLLVLAAAGVWWGIARLASYELPLSLYWRANLSVGLRHWLPLSTLLWLYHAAIMVLRWLVVPALFLPLWSGAAHAGFRGLGRASGGRPAIRDWTYWLGLAVAAAIGVWASAALMAATPNFLTSTARSEWTSLVLRGTAAYLLAVGAWLGALALASPAPPTVDAPPPAAPAPATPGRAPGQNA